MDPAIKSWFYPLGFALYVGWLLRYMWQFWRHLRTKEPLTKTWWLHATRQLGVTCFLLPTVLPTRGGFSVLCSIVGINIVLGTTISLIRQNPKAYQQAFFGPRKKERIANR